MPATSAAFSSMAPVMMRVRSSRFMRRIVAVSRAIFASRKLCRNTEDHRLATHKSVFDAPVRLEWHLGRVGELEVLHIKCRHRVRHCLAPGDLDDVVLHETATWAEKDDERDLIR